MLRGRGTSAQGLEQRTGTPAPSTVMGCWRPGAPPNPSRAEDRDPGWGMGAWHNHDCLGKGWGFPALPRRPLASSWAGGDLHKAVSAARPPALSWGGADREESWDSRCSAAPGRVLAAGPASAPRAGVRTPSPAPTTTTNPHPARPFLPARFPFPYSGYSLDPGPGDPAPPAGEGSRGREEGDGLKAGSFELVLHGWLPPSPPATLRVPAFPSPVLGLLVAGRGSPPLLLPLGGSPRPFGLCQAEVKPEPRLGAGLAPARTGLACPPPPLSLHPSQLLRE